MSYWSNGVGGCFLDDDYHCDKSESYLNRILVSGNVKFNNEGANYLFNGHSMKSNPVNGRVACYISNDGVNDYIQSISESVEFSGEPDPVVINLAFQYTDTSYDPPINYWSYGCQSGDGIGPNVGRISTNVPVFETHDEAISYIQTGEGIENAINYEADEIEPDTTETYHCYNGYATGTQKNGSVTTGRSLSHNYIRVQANARPVLYFDPTSYSMTAIYKSVISWKGNYTGDDISDLDVSEFTVGNVVGHTSFYGNKAAYIYARGSILPDGTYTYGFEFDTDFAIYSNREDAITGLETGDYSGASNYPQIQSGKTEITIETGETSGDTVFGGGAFTSPFSNSYVMNATALGEVAAAFFTDDTTLLNNIKQGLELFGSNPYEAIVGLSAFPFDVTTMVGTSGQQYIYFGSYQKTLSNTVYKVINRNAKYIDAGTVYVAPIFNSFRDFEPWTSLSAYLPFCGWQKLDIATYLGKYVNIRYYVDIMTRTGIVVLVADGVMCDYFVCGEMGVELPISGQNLSRYANDMLNGLLTAGGGVVGGAFSGAMMGSAIPGVGTAVGAGMGALLGGTMGLAKGTFDMSQKGKPKDHNMTKGTFSGGCGCYMPYYVTFRYDVADVVEPENLTSLYGRPSSYSGRLGNLSGFVKVDTIKMNTSGMSDNNITEVVNLVKEGIFL